MADGKQFYQVAKDLPGTEFMLLTNGGHNPDTYFSHFPELMRWLGKQGL